MKMVTNNKTVRLLAKKAGVWPPLRRAMREQKSVALLHGDDVFITFTDGLLLLTCETVDDRFIALETLSMAIGPKRAYLYEIGREIH